jgi:3-oxoacyl-[acyl-carrier protein] reductase
MRLKDKVAIITGAARGIGQATAVKFAQEGARVVVCDLKPEWLTESVSLCQAKGVEALGCAADVRDMKSLEAMIAATLAKWGRIDCLVNNAGIVADAQLKNMTEEQFDNVIDINLKGVYNCTKAVVNTMLAQQSGVILNASSIVGLYGNFGQTNYAASKFAVIGMMKTWARELGRKGIRANAICPGFIATSILTTIPDKVLKALEEKVPMGRLGTPEEVANTFAWLASDEASYINGAVIEVSGGLTI